VSGTRISPSRRSASRARRRWVGGSRTGVKMQHDEPQASGPTPQGRSSDEPPKKRPAQRRRSSARRPRATDEVAKDIAPILKGWDYESGTINVRKVVGLDGLPK